MLKLLTSVFVLGFFCLIFTASSATAQEPMAGGYSSVSKNDAQVKAAAKYAVAREARRVKRGITLISISKAEQQVVAGMNYQVCMKVRDGRKTRWASAVVYRHWKGTRSLTSWDWGACNW